MLDVTEKGRAAAAMKGPPLDFQQHLALLEAQGIAANRIHIESFSAGNPAREDTAGVMPSQRQRTIVGYLTLAAVAAFVAQAFLVPQMPLLHRLQTSIVYSALTGVAVILLALLQWRLSYARALGSRQEGGHDHDARMHGTAFERVVEVFAMRGRAVHECGAGTVERA